MTFSGQPRHARARRTPTVRRAARLRHSSAPRRDALPSRVILLSRVIWTEGAHLESYDVLRNSGHTVSHEIARGLLL